MKNLLLTVIAILGLAISSFAQVPPYVPTNGLIAWWPFDGNANDASGNGIDGTTFDATLTTDRFGNADRAYYFDGVDDYIETNISSFLVLNSDFSISVWIKPTQLHNTIIHILPSSLNQGIDLGIRTADSKLQFSIYDGSYQLLVSSDPVIADQWINIVFVHNSSTSNIYVGGVLSQTGSIPNCANSANKKITFGKHGTVSSSNFDGVIDDIGIWNRTLTQQEITGLYEAVNCSAPITVSIDNLNSTYTTSDSPVALTGSPTGGTFYGTGVYNNTFYPSNAGAGSHTIVYAYADPYGCSNAICENTDITTFVKQETAQNNLLNIYPNPNSGDFRIVLEDTYIGSIEVFINDFSGKQLLYKKYQNKSDKFEEEINLKSLSKGSYTVLVKYGTKSVSRNVVLQ